MTGHDVAVLSRTTIAKLAADNGWGDDVVQAGNVLITADYVRGVSPLHRTKLERIVLNVPRGRWDSNEQFYTNSNGKRAVTKHTLEQMAYLAGVRWIENRELGEYHPDRVLWTSTGAIRGMNGEWYAVTKSKEWQYAVEEAKVLERAKTLTKGQEKRPATEQERAAYIASECARLREHRVSMAESKAQARVLRALLGVPASAGDDYWRRPFYIPRTDPHLDPTDPDVRAAILDDAHGSSHRLGFTRTAQHRAPIDDLDATTVEIIEPTEPGEQLTHEQRDEAQRRLDDEFPLPDQAPDPGDVLVDVGTGDKATIADLWERGPIGQMVVRGLTTVSDDTTREAASAFLANHDN